MVNDAPEITVLQLPKFKAEATKLIGIEGIEALAAYLADHPDAVYGVIAARVFLIRCYAKNVKTNLTEDEKKQLRQIAANLKGAH
jgi:hypothetical protein